MSDARSRVFVAGATGVVGRRAVAELVAAGHSVTGVARAPEKARLLEGIGATPVSVDLFDSDAVKVVVEGHDVVCNLVTHIPPGSQMMRAGAWAENDRLRREASRHLVDAALAGGASRYVQESIAFTYEDRGDEWIDEDTPSDFSGLTSSVGAAEAQARRFTDAGGAGIVLRFGSFYGADSAHTLDYIRLARRRFAMSVAKPGAYISSIHAGDAGRAVVAALRAPAGVYNVVDNEPLTRRQYFDALADALGVKRPWLSAAMIGALTGKKTRVVRRSQRVSNRRFEEATGWAPRYRSVREGFPAVVAELAETNAEEERRHA